VGTVDRMETEEQAHMETVPLTTNGDVPSVAAAPQTDDTLDVLLSQNTEQIQNARYWQWVALGAVGLALACAGLAYIGWWTRPAVVPMVQHVYVDEQGTATSVGSPIPMAEYTPADWQWVQMLREWVLRLRWRGLDERQMALAWEWLRWHTCGQAVEHLNRYHTVDKPFELIGVKKREVTTINVAKGDLPQVYTVIWTEVLTNGPQAPVTSTQSVSFAVARREVEKAGRQINPFGLCVRAFGGLNL
jgi:type IV secretory pathway TrbF-like protein